MATYEDLGLKTIINAAGTHTNLGGTLMDPEVIEAMEKASRNFVDTAELMEKAGTYIANLLNTEAAMITSGAASGLTLSAAACMVGKNKAKINALPETKGEKNEIIIMRCHRNPYDQALKLAGAEFKEIGNAIATHPWELEAAINENTAAVTFFVQSDMLEASLNLNKVISISHKYQIPVIVDAAAELPPFSNLHKFIEMGADLVLFSGGKDIRGPQSSGLILGKKDLIDKGRAHAYPHHGVGRPMKLDKETIMGFVKALEIYIKKDQKKAAAQRKKQRKYLKDNLEGISGLKVYIDKPSQPLTQPPLPRVYIEFKDKNKIDKKEMADKLRSGEPPIVVFINSTSMEINTHTLQKGEEKIIVNRIQEIMENI